MQVKLGDHVRTSDGKDVGKIETLIVDPATDQLKTAVVRKGFILPDDIEIPLDELERRTDDLLILHRTEAQLADLPRFFEANYTPPPATYLAPYGLPISGLLWPIGWLGGYPPPTALPPDSEARRLIEAGQQADLANAVLNEGSDVLSRDGEKIGRLHRVTFDTASRQPSSLVVQRGHLRSEAIELPASAIASVDDLVITLRLTKQEVEARFEHASR